MTISEAAKKKEVVNVVGDVGPLLVLGAVCHEHASILLEQLVQRQLFDVLRLFVPAWRRRDHVYAQPAA
jgi:hypothetical protein